MFLFLMLPFVVAWALCLVVWTRQSSRSDYKGRAESWGPTAIGSQSGWSLFQSRVLQLARGTVHWSASPIDRQLACRLSDDSRRIDGWKLRDGTLERWGLTSWSKKPKETVAIAVVARFGKHRATDWLAHIRSKLRDEVESCLLSPAR